MIDGDCQDGPCELNSYAGGATMPKTKKTPEQIAREKEEKKAIKQEEKLIKEGYGPFNQASNTCGNESTAEYIAGKYEDAVIIYHPADKLWGKIWKVWVKQGGGGD